MADTTAMGGGKPAVGAAAPDFELPTDGAGPFRLGAHRGRKVVVYFYPKDDTSGCTKEAIDFTQARAAFDAADTEVVGISADSADKHAKFRAKHELGIALAADEDRSAIEAYGVWVEKSMYGRKYMGIERATFLIDRDGRIARVWEKVKVPGHVEEVLAAARAL